MAIKWNTGKLRPKHPLEVTWNGHTYRGWVSDIFREAIRRAEHEGRRLSSNWQDGLWEAMMAKYPRYIIKQVVGDAPVTVSVESVKSFIRFVIKRGMNSSYVEPEEAERRAEICRRCPKRGPMSGCTACRAAAESLVKPPNHHLDFGTRYNQKVAACSACGCYLDLKCWIPADQLADEVDKHDWSDICWMRQLKSPPGEA